MYKVMGYKLNDRGQLVSVFEQLIKTLTEAEKKVEEILEFGYNNYEIVFNETVIKRNFISQGAF